MTGTLVRRVGNEEIYICPFCTKRRGSPDRSGHLYSNIINKFFICHRCGAKGRNVSIASNTHALPLPANNLLDYLDSLYEADEEDRTHPESGSLPPGVTPILTNSLAHDYLRGRGISNSDIVFYSLLDLPAEGRVLIPIYVDNNIRYWMTRSYINTTPKYKNSPTPKYNVIFNYDHARYYNTVVVCEGAFSAINVGRNAVALLGKYASFGQIKLLSELPCKRIVVLLDGDALDSSLDLAGKLSYYRDVHICPLPYDKDPADYTRDAILSIIDSCSIRYELSSELRLRLDQELHAGR